MGEELRWVGCGQADLFESFREGARGYAAGGGGVEDLEAGAQGVEEGWWEGGVGACAAVEGWAGCCAGCGVELLVLFLLLLGRAGGVGGGFGGVVGEVWLAEGCD